MVDNQQVLGGIGGMAFAGLFFLLLITGGGSHAATDPLLCSGVEARWDRCLAEDVNGDGSCAELGEQAMNCRLSLQGGSSLPTSRNDAL